MAFTHASSGYAFARALKLRRYEMVVDSLCTVLQLFAALAFFLALVMVTYTPVVGWIVLEPACHVVILAVSVYFVDTWL